MMIEQPRCFKNRIEAGAMLAHALAAHAGRADVILLALPRGGVPVAAPMARRLGLPLDIVLVRKLGFPGQEEFAMGAIGSGGACVMQEDVVRDCHIPPQLIEATTRRELQEIERREQCYRAGRGAPSLAGQTVILVDDGMATGSTMQVAVQVVRQSRPARVIVAVPVASREACDALRARVDECLCLITPQAFSAVGEWYEHFRQVSDREVTRLLAAAGKRGAGTSPPIAAKT